MNISEITIPISLQLTPQSRALVDALVAAGTPGFVPKPAPWPAPPTAADTPPIPGAYWPGQGGIYLGDLPAFGDQPAVHMVGSIEEREELAYGGRGTDVQGATSRTNGRANTAALLAHGKAHGIDFPAAAWCAQHVADGHQDFHLPSQAELFMAMLHCQHAFKKDGWYWTSTQDSAFNAFGQGFEDGGSVWGIKDSKFRVRAVRWIPL